MNLDERNKKRHLWFFCNSCLVVRRAAVTLDLREGLVCPSCCLNSRQRAILFAAQRTAKKGFFRKKNLSIVGISDGAPIESAFSVRFGKIYKNFEFHTEPFLDITNVNDILESSADVVICSEVLEHVQPPINLAFNGLYKLLKSGGWLILSVPHRGATSAHEEHFPVMTNSEIITVPIQMLRGIDVEGNEREFTELVFHGGAGATLEYRVFSERSLRDNLENSGFKNIQSQSDVRLIGCVWEPWSRVWLAQKPEN
jgi:SAM-dependent methyltransferase